MTASQRAVYERPPLTGYQTAFLDVDARYTVVEASTKVGKTVACIVWLTEHALRGSPGKNYWWVAPVVPQTKIAFRRLKRFLPEHLYEKNEAELTITLLNGATIFFKGADNPDTLYGEDVYAAVIDEATRCREDSWYAIRTTLTATRGPIKIIGNVKGRRNWAYQLARMAETDTLPGVAYFRITAWDAVKAGILDQAEVEDAKRILPLQVFRQDYEAIPADDGGNPFGLSAIEACLGDLSDGIPAVWGWDLAKAQDWTVGIALDKDGHVCRMERWQAPWRSTKADIAQMAKQTPCLVDSTGVGDPVLEDLQAMGMNAEGFHFSGPSKQKLMEGLAMAIHQRDVSYPPGPIKDELDAFEYQYTRTGVRYGAMEGMHDDCVCALALAWQHYRDLHMTSERDAAGLRNILTVYEGGAELEPWQTDELERWFRTG